MSLLVSLPVSLSPCPSFSRIYEILPQRIQQWQQSPCVAEEMGRRQLERIRKEQQAARLRLTLMEKRFHELEGIIANAKQQQVQQHEEVRDRQTQGQLTLSLIHLSLSDLSVSACLSACMSLYVFLCLSFCLSFSLPVFLSACLPLCLSFYR